MLGSSPNTLNKNFIFIKTFVITPVFNLYWSELFWRVYYTFFSFLSSFFITFYFVDIFLLLEVKPLINLGYNTLIATGVADLINSVIQSVLFVSSVVVFPLFSYHLYFFLVPCLYAYQLKILQIYLTCTFNFVSIGFLTTYIFLLPGIFKFCFYWEMQSTQALFEVIVNVRIQEYLLWTGQFYNLLGIMLHLLFCSFIILLLLYATTYTFFLFSLYRKQLLFFLIFLFYLVIPPDTTLQIIILFLFIVYRRISIFTVCFRLKQLFIK
uniref:Preprotein translocase subunit SecY n=1 Tax=Palmaria palmata TaxID=2822 RepID=A0A0A7A743_PALPL|nr:preprotein translocase subunit SecY [Palmaria palmata]AHB62168.1 preprotein translocase subunit SecY [Palmaria palmata]